MPSSVIQWMRYDPEARVLTIAFRGGRGTYRYAAVPVEEWNAFRSAASKGTYLNEVFKGKKYRYGKVAAAISLVAAAGEKQVFREAQDDKLFFWGEVGSDPAIAQKSLTKKRT